MARKEYAGTYALRIGTDRLRRLDAIVERLELESRAEFMRLAIDREFKRLRLPETSTGEGEDNG